MVINLLQIHQNRRFDETGIKHIHCRDDKSKINHKLISSAMYLSIGRLDTYGPIYSKECNRDYVLHYNMTVVILAGNEIDFAIAAGLIRLHIPSG